MSLKREGDEVVYAVDRLDPPRARMRCRWRVGSQRPRARPGDLAHFLTERYQLFTTDDRGRVRRCRIHHEPWPLREADLIDLDEDLVAAAGMAVPNEAPVLYHADHLRVYAGLLERA